MYSTSIYGVNDSALLSPFHHHFFLEVWLMVLKPCRKLPCSPAHCSGRRWGDSYSLWDHSHNLLDTCWKAHHREEEPICVEILKHPLHRLPIDAERDAGHSEVQATAHHVIWFQEVLVDGGHGSGNAAWWTKNKKKVWLWKKRLQATSGRWEAWRHAGGPDMLLHLNCNFAFRKLREMSNEKWFPKLVSGQPETTGVSEETLTLPEMRTNKNSTCLMRSDSGINNKLPLLGVGPWAGGGGSGVWVGVRGCVCVHS